MNEEDNTCKRCLCSSCINCDCPVMCNANFPCMAPVHVCEDYISDKKEM